MGTNIDNLLGVQSSNKRVSAIDSLLMPEEPTQENKKPIKIAEERLDEFGLPKSIISAAPLKLPKKETFLKKAAKMVLPRSLEIKFGLTEPNIKENIMRQEDDRQSYYRDKEFEKVLKREGVDLKNPPKLPEGYREPEGFWGSLVEGVKLNYNSTMKPFPGYLVESLGVEFNNPQWRKWGH